MTRNTVFDTDHEFKPGWSVYCEVCELLDWMHGGPRMPKMCTHEGGEWPGLGYCADCKMTLPEGTKRRLTRISTFL